MNDLELQTRLQSAPLPERPDEYWDDFPSRVRRQLRHRPAISAAGPARRMPVFWNRDFALASAVILLFCVQLHAMQLTCAALNKHEHALHMQLARLDAGLNKLMLNTDGLGDLLTEAN